MAKDSEEARARAEARFKKAEAATEAAHQSHAEQEAKARTVEEKTSRLKAQRLARDAAEAVKPAKPAKKPG